MFFLSIDRRDIATSRLKKTVEKRLVARRKKPRAMFLRGRRIIRAGIATRRYIYIYIYIRLREKTNLIDM